MSLLELEGNSAQNTNPSRNSMVRSALIAGAILAVALVGLWFYAHQPPPLEGQVVQLWIHPMHTVLSRRDAAGVIQAPEQFDQVLVLAQIHLHNRSGQPVILKQLMTNLTLPDGMDSSYAATATDYDRVFAAYPELARLRTEPLRSDTMIAAKSSVDGMIVSSFQLTDERWKQQSGMNFEIDLKMHPALILTAKTPGTIL